MPTVHVVPWHLQLAFGTNRDEAVRESPAAVAVGDLDGDGGAGFSFVSSLTVTAGTSPAESARWAAIRTASPAPAPPVLDRSRRRGADRLSGEDCPDPVRVHPPYGIIFSGVKVGTDRRRAGLGSLDYDAGEDCRDA